MTHIINPPGAITADGSLSAPRRVSTRGRVLLAAAVAIAATIFAFAISDEPTPTTNSRPQIANQLRWEGLAEYVQSQSTRGQAAEAARWQGLAEHHGAR